ncbi:MAG: hypothetical protein ACR2F6_13120 [Mycobacteriales bacterium]
MTVQPGDGPATTAPAAYAAPPAAAPTGWRAIAPHWQEVAAAAALLLGLAVVGVLAGLVWNAISPRVTYTIVSKGQGVADEISEAAFSQDGWFIVIGLVIGIAAGLTAWRVKRARGPLALVALGVSALLGAYLARRIGLAAGNDPSKAETARIFNQVGAHLQKPLQMRTRVDLLAEPTAAVVTYLLCLGFSSWGLTHRGAWRSRLHGRGPGPPAPAADEHP